MTTTKSIQAPRAIDMNTEHAELRAMQASTDALFPFAIWMNADKSRRKFSADAEYLINHNLNAPAFATITFEGRS